MERTAAICARFFPDVLPSSGDAAPYVGDRAGLVPAALEYLERCEPWALARRPERRAELAHALDLLCTRCLEAAADIERSDPDCARRIRERIGEPSGGVRQVRTGEPLFYTPPVERPLVPPTSLACPAISTRTRTSTTRSSTATATRCCKRFATRALSWCSFLAATLFQASWRSRLRSRTRISTPRREYTRTRPQTPTSRTSPA